MTFHNLFFKFIDVWYDRFQNRRRGYKFENVACSVFSDIVYDSADPETCRLDLYRPAASENAVLPVVFYLHGGGFEAGDKHCRRALSRWLVSLGYAVVNVNYGLAPAYKFPSQQIQLACALNWVEANAAEYGLDLAKMVIAGDSAGGYYAAMLAHMCTDESLQLRLGVKLCSKFGAAIFNCAVYDFYSLATRKMLFNLGKYICYDITGVRPEQQSDYEYRQLLSLPELITKDFPPSLIIWSERDILCHGQAEIMLAAMREKGLDFTEYHSSKQRDNHCFSLMWKGDAAHRANRLIRDFLINFKDNK